MKNRALTLAFTACLLSSLAFADNPTDAALVPSDGNSSAVQKENCKDCASGKHHSKKDQSLSFKPKHEPERSSQDSREQHQSDPEYPANGAN